MGRPNLIRQYGDYVCRLMKRYLFWVIHFPCHRKESLDKEISVIGQEITTEDCDEYDRSSSDHRSLRRQIVIILVCLMYFIKNFWVPFILVKTIDFKAPGINGPNEKKIDAGTFELYCVQTNCTQFFLLDSKLRIDTRHVPIIPICYPNLSRIYTSTIFLNQFAILIHAMVGLMAAVWGVIVPLVHIWSNESRCDALMFIVAPGLTRNLMFSRAHKIYQVYKTSFAYYIKKCRSTRVSDCGVLTINTRSFGVINSKILTRRPRRTLIEDFKAERHMRDTYLINIQAPMYDDQHEFIKDCLPCIRASDRQPGAQSLLIKWFLISFLAFSLDASLKLEDLVKRTFIKSQEVEFVQKEMYRSGCRSWYTDSITSVLEPDQVWTMRWNLYTWVEFGVLLPIVFFASCLMTLYRLINYELSCWLLELHDGAKILIEVTRIQIMGTNKLSVYKNQVKKVDNSLFQSPLNSWTDAQLDYLYSDKLVVKVLIQQLALGKMSKSDFASDTHADMLTKLHVSYRLFTDHVRHCSKTVPLLTLGTYMVTFGILSIAVWHSRLIGRFSLDHMITSLICATWSIAVLYLMSNFHAKSRRTERTFWSLMAALTEGNSGDKRMFHLRLLWLKQLVVISNEEGVAVTMYGMRVTHVNVLHTILWITSLITLAAY